MHFYHIVKTHFSCFFLILFIYSLKIKILYKNINIYKKITIKNKYFYGKKCAQVQAQKFHVPLLVYSSMLSIPNYGKSYFWYKKLLNQILKQICSEQYCKWVCFYFYLFLLVFNIILVFFFFFIKNFCVNKYFHVILY